MMNVIRRAGSASALLLAVAGGLLAQGWKTSNSLPDVDFGNLSPAQKASVLKILREQDCSCGCGRKLAQCRVEDPTCSYSKGLSAAVVRAIAQGKTESEATAAIMPHLLDAPVSIPVAGAPSLGPANAPITVIEFSDFQCPYCVAAFSQIHDMLKAFPTQVKLIFKQYPLEIHSQADLAAAAAIAAQKQGKFWQMHDALFQNHDDLSRKNILVQAAKNGLDMKKFEDDIDSTVVRETVVRDVQDGDNAGVQGTPTIFINGQRYNGSIALDQLRPVLEAELKTPGRQTASAR